MKVDLRKIYRFEPLPAPTEGSALPSGGDVFYECLQCNQVVSSVPFTPAECECGNLKGDKGAISIGDAAKIRPVRGKLK